MLACMTAQHHEPPVAGRLAETPAAVRAVLAASAVPEVVAQYETEMDADLPPVARTPPVWGQTLGSGGR
jgi:hypothetical protein